MATKRRNAWKQLDQRSGRLERAVSLVEDGETGVMTTKRDRDYKHPLSTAFVAPLDRATIKGDVISEEQHGTTTVNVGMLGSGNDFTREAVPVMALHVGGGVISYKSGATGYSELGFGEGSYGGWSIDKEGTY